MLKLSSIQNLNHTAVSLFNRMDLLIFKENNAHIVYAPALDLSGYGNTKKEAESSFLISLKEFLEFTNQKDTLKSELSRLGWTSDNNNIFTPPFFDELLQKNAYLSEIVREKSFQKHNLVIPSA